MMKLIRTQICKKLRFSSLVEGLVADESKGKIWGKEERYLGIECISKLEEDKKLIFKK